MLSRVLLHMVEPSAPVDGQADFFINLNWLLGVVNVLQSSTLHIINLNGINESSVIRLAATFRKQD